MLQVRRSSGSRRFSRASADLDISMPGGILKTPGGTSKSLGGTFKTPGGLRRRSSRASRASGDLSGAKSRTKTVMFENVLFDEPEAQEVCCIAQALV